ncbi:hypothetical protein FRC04_008417 [Tulasnella sp. 424]|nr:hypothetical protein FRC04_008417 [Tulasnella sp. 424]KAG8976788.1 hypothetical protein FRC05_003138 [Tulasnella sp. 425]
MPSEHPKYGDASYMVFLIEDILFQVPIRRLKQSQYFHDMIDEAHTGLESEGKNNQHPIFLTGISAFEMTSFLDVLDASLLYGDPGLTSGQWGAALHLATMWSFDDIRERIILQMDKIISTVDAMDRIDTSLKCRVEKWLHPAYEELCKRATGLSDVEAERLGLRRSTAIWRIREALRSTQTPAPQSDPYGPYPQRGYPGAFSSMRSSSWNPPMPAVIIQTQNALDLIQREKALKFP